ncbi:MAG TPA: hypothetical protein VFC51_09475, partial [Chloroflexota bacterium]|nr:hypothetical protein [Chloroflexota bacterium]
RTPYAALKAELPNIDEAIRFPIPFLLDDVSVRLGPWSGYHLLAHHPASLGAVGADPWMSASIRGPT